MSLEETQAPATEVAATEAAQPEQAAAPSQDDAAFEQGFNAAQGKEVTAPAPVPEPAPEPAPEPEPEPAPPAEPEFTTAQIKELVEKVSAMQQRESKVFGTIGALKQQLDQFKAQPQPSQAAIKLTAEKLKRLSAEFPEMAAMLSEDLNEALAGAPAAPALDPQQLQQQVQQIIDGRLTETSRTYEMKLLSLQHRDWQQVVQSPEFKTWKESLPEKDRTELDNSWEASFIGEKLTEFKDWKNKTVQTTQNRKARLEAAITPRGNPQSPPAPSAEDAFVSGFKQARGLA